ncbi:hypothetical protein FORC17_2720 [Vibrio vulnificus]|uniref:O-antigen ligase family protein n=1 Tax=Vibrio vulnificus TaxID=672 RepID=UPI0007EE7D60|nr:O-antigen ligase family protein [Vibrio vulnificus]ANN27783.1 hypothetical protein FORC17_2720 [Vibrio vulnificus]
MKSTSLDTFQSLFLALFVVSGMIKGSVAVFNINIPDITLLSFIILLFSIHYASVKLTRVQVLIIAFWLVFFAFYALSFVYTPVSDYAKVKFLGLVINTLALFILGFLSVDFRKFTVYVATFSFVCFVFNLIASTLFPIDFAGDKLKGAYLTVGLFLGFSTLLLEKEGYRKLAVLFLLLILFLGARGPFLFTLICYLGLKLTKFDISYIFRGTIVLKLILYFTLLFIISAGLYLNFDFVTEGIDRAIFRLTLLFESEDKGESVSQRIYFLKVAMEMWSANTWFGSGMGSFSFYAFGDDFRAFPHNVFLEIFSEAGIIPGTIFLFLFCSVLVYCYIKSYWNVFFITVYCILNISKSSAFEDIRFVFVFVFLFLFDLIKLESNSRS